VSSSDSPQREVTVAEVEEFEREYKRLVLPIANVNGPRLASDPSLPDGREVIKVGVVWCSNRTLESNFGVLYSELWGLMLAVSSGRELRGVTLGFCTVN